MHDDHKTTTDELLRNALAAAVVLLLVGLGTMITMGLLK